MEPVEFKIFQLSINSDEHVAQEHETSPINSEGIEDEEYYKTQNKFRTALPQVLATCAQSLLLFALGMMLAISTVVIAALLNTKTGFSITSSQASWFASIIFACQPIGSILSGILSDIFGRKKSMLAVCIPQMIGWILIYTAQSVLVLYLAAVMLGFSIGFMEAPTLSYVGEISQPRLRAILAGFTSICVSIGYDVMLLIGKLTTWRMSAAISASVPVITAIAILQVPESPIWLLSKGRKKDAEEALCWLRGWVSPEIVQNEFRSISSYVDKSKQTGPKVYSSSRGKVYTAVCENGTNSSDEEVSCNKKRWYHSEKLRYIFQPEMIRPLRLVVFYFFFFHCAAFSGFRPFMVQIFESLRLPIDARWFTVVVGFLQISGGLIFMAIVRIAGKRSISILSITICSTICVLLGLYNLLYKQYDYFNPWIPVYLFALLFFFMSIGIQPVPWTLISEVFPTRGRGIGGGLCAASYYIIYFTCTKTFLDFKNLIQLHGIFFFYGSLGFVGLVFVYFCLPETEGKRLEDIENNFKSTRESKT